MPTYLLHGFRWHRASIRIHIILQDLEDAAAEWIVAPATSITLLNSFYSLYDFLPPSHPPTAPTFAPTATSSNAKEYEQHMISRHRGGIGQWEKIPPPPEIPFEEEYKVQPPKTLTRRNKSMASLRSLGRKKKPANLAPQPTNNTLRPTTAVNGASNGYHSHQSSDLRPRTSAAASVSTTRTHTSHSRSHSGVNGAGTKAPKPISFNDWSVVKLVEQYDLNDMEVVSQPYAYVADYMCEVRLSKGLKEEMEQYEERRRKEMEDRIGAVHGGSPIGSSGINGSHGKHGGSMSSLENGGGVAMSYDNGAYNGNSHISGSPTINGPSLSTNPSTSGALSPRDLRRKSKRQNWFEKLRDGLQKNEEIGWFVVVCGDEERTNPTDDEDADLESAERSEMDERNSWGSESVSPQRPPKSGGGGGGFRSFFSRRRPVVDE
jgi:hypothetical protein